jgi:glycerol uptake facilitator-like aquaporin
MSADRDYPAYFNVLNTQRIIGFEMLGMFFLALGATSCSYSALVDVCIPNVVFWVNVLSGPFTGAHLNAMITMSWVFKSWKQFQLPASFVFVYILAQCAGAFLGGAMLYFIHSTV